MGGARPEADAIRGDDRPPRADRRPRRRDRRRRRHLRRAHPDAAPRHLLVPREAGRRAGDRCARQRGRQGEERRALRRRPGDPVPNPDAREHGGRPLRADHRPAPRPRSVPKLGRGGTRGARALRPRVRDARVLPVADVRPCGRRRLGRPEA